MPEERTPHAPSAPQTRSVGAERSLPFFVAKLARSLITLYVCPQTFSCDSFPEAHRQAEGLHRPAFSSNDQSQQNQRALRALQSNPPS